MDDSIRDEIATCLEGLAAMNTWDDALWQRCYGLVTTNSDDELVAYIEDDLIHCSGRRLFHSEPIRRDFGEYAQEFRDFAAALRYRMSLSDYKKHYE